MRHVTSIWYHRSAMLLLLLTSLFALLTFKQHGISNDELVQHTYGQLLLKFYASGLSDQSAFHYKNLYLYGGFFDVIAAGLEQLTPLWVWDMRHLLTAGFGVLGLMYAWRYGRLLGGLRAGFLVLVTMLITAPWTGAMFTHTKDIPFATCMLMALYYSALILQTCTGHARSVSLNATAIKLGLAIGCALGMRIGGGFAVVYILLALALLYVFSAPFKAQLHQQLSPFLKASFVVAVISFGVMAIFWPWGVMSPSNPFKAIHEFSHFSFNMLTIENHHVYPIGDVPRTYLLDYLRVKLPELSLIGLLFFLVFVANPWHRLQHRVSQLGLMPAYQAPLILLLVAVLFPIVFVLATKPALYNGVRHFTFIIPPLTIMAGLGLHMAFARFDENVYAHGALVSGCVAFILLAASQFHALHPYEYTYYNMLAGKEYQVNNSWEGDYWSSSLREAATTLTSLSLPKQDTPFLVAVCAENIQASAYLDPRFAVTKDWTAADFYLSSTNMHCDQVLKGAIISVVKRRHTVLAVVKDRRQLRGDDRLAMPAPN